MTVVFRVLPGLAGLALLLLLSAGAAAQSSGSASDNCTRTNPCLLNIEVNDQGFFLIDDVLYDDPKEDHLQFTLGDWYEFSVFNDDVNRSHTITLSGHDVSVTVPADDFVFETGAFEFAKEGVFTLRDEPSGDEFPVHVGEQDSLADGTSKSSGIPAVPVALLAAALAIGAAARRR